jgi:hypothetical protein
MQLSTLVGSYQGDHCEIEISQVNSEFLPIEFKFTPPGLVFSKVSKQEFGPNASINAEKTEITAFTGDEDNTTVHFELDGNENITSLTWDENHSAPFEIPHTDHYVCQKLVKSN